MCVSGCLVVYVCVLLSWWRLVLFSSCLVVEVSSFLGVFLFYQTLTLMSSYALPLPLSLGI
jgi:hypothetical protein